MITLALDASTYTGDVAVIVDDRVAAEQSTAMKGVHEERLMPAVAHALDAASVDRRSIDRIVCGKGPGSFTSLRIAGAIAKGLASGLDKPLYAVPSMALVLGGAGLGAGRYVVAIDALRGELYVGLYDVDPRRAITELEPARLIAAVDVHRVATEFEARIVSPSRIEGAVVAMPRAAAVARLEGLLEAFGPVNVDRWEPSYGRLAEAQVKWESAHGRPLPAP
ncbi:MAG: tRNA (adenosine(37)-N6)-threonylcarbamoyltransferase complex dimerization subunit type 1 TsaB [Gemmatimonadaceae bacterium]